MARSTPRLTADAHRYLVMTRWPIGLFAVFAFLCAGQAALRVSLVLLGVIVIRGSLWLPAASISSMQCAMASVLGWQAAQAARALWGGLRGDRAEADIERALRALARFWTVAFVFVLLILLAFVMLTAFATLHPELFQRLFVPGAPP